jgi:TAP42-like family
MTVNWDDVARGVGAEDVPLRELFDICHAAHSSLDSLPRDAEAAQHALQNVLSLLQQCDLRVDAAGLFADNEDEDDVSTWSLRRVSVLLWFILRGVALGGDVREWQGRAVRNGTGQPRAQLVWRSLHHQCWASQLITMSHLESRVLTTKREYSQVHARAVLCG